MSTSRIRLSEAVQVLLVGRQVVQAMLETVLHRAEVRASRRHVLDRVVDRGQAADGAARGQGRLATREVEAGDLQQAAGAGGAGGALRLAADVAIVSPSLAPTWKVTRLPPSAVAVELGALGDVLDLAPIWETSAAIASWSSDQRAVLELDLEVTHPLQHGMHLVEGTFRRLDERDAVLGVALRLREATDLAGASSR